MTNVVEMKTNDTAPPLKAVLLERATRKPVDLTGCSAAFNMRKAGATAAKVQRGAATIVDAAGGTVAYDWQAGDTDTAGEYQGEFEITLPGGSVRTFPSDGYISITINEGIA